MSESISIYMYINKERASEQNREREAVIVFNAAGAKQHDPCLWYLSILYVAEKETTEIEGRVWPYEDALSAHRDPAPSR